jgi:peptidoglycan hydrolase-like protein with peptidoglycan-binding domain
MKYLTLAAAALALAIGPAAIAQEQPGQQQQMQQAEGAQLTLSPERVAEIQKQLNERGFSAGDPDGQMGPNTSSAIQKFQQAEGLPVTGSLTLETVQALGVGLDPGEGQDEAAAEGQDNEKDG